MNLIRPLRTPDPQDPVALRFRQALRERDEEGALRRLSLSDSHVDFTSNDYLGFAQHTCFDVESPRLPAGAGGSRLLSGHHPIHDECEKRIAEYHGAEAALLFVSGYSANLALMASVPKRGDRIFYDQQVHASIRDGIRLGYGRGLSFASNDVGSLRHRLQSAGEGQAFVVCEVNLLDGWRSSPVEGVWGPLSRVRGGVAG